MVEAVPMTAQVPAVTACWPAHPRLRRPRLDVHDARRALAEAERTRPRQERGHAQRVGIHAGEEADGVDRVEQRQAVEVDAVWLHGAPRVHSPAV